MTSGPGRDHRKARTKVEAANATSQRRLLAAAAGGLAILALLWLALVSPAAAQARDDFADLADRLTPAVVNISTSQSISRSGGRVPFPELPEGHESEDLFRDFFGGRDGEEPRRVSSLGSGFVIDPAGIIVTNNHVVAEADEIKAVFADGSELPATVVGTDEDTDIAVLRVRPEGRLAAVTWGDSDDARVGQWVIAIGNPFGLGGSVSAGIISARSRDIRAGPYDDFLQTDAAINRGNSGGPLFNMDGEVVGVNTAIISPSGGSIGIGFSVPSNLAQMVVADLLEFGEVQRGWLGVNVQRVSDDMAGTYGLDSARGALVTFVDPEGPAAAAGLQAGDLVLSFGGREVEEMRDLPRIVADSDIESEQRVVFIRDGERRTVTVTVGKREEDVAEAPLPEIEDEPRFSSLREEDIDALGIEVIELAPDVREEFGISDDIEGVLVTGVDPDGPSREVLRRGDVVVQVESRDVALPREILNEVSRVQQADKPMVRVYLNRDGTYQFGVVRLPDNKQR